MYVCVCSVCVYVSGVCVCVYVSGVCACVLACEVSDYNYMLFIINRNS